MNERAQAQSIGDGYQFATSYPTPTGTQSARADLALARAVTAYRYWYPTVSVDAMFQGNSKIGIAPNTALGITSADPRQVGFTPNSDTPYGVCTLDLSAGPIVIELPAGPFIGVVNDHNFRWVTDMGIPSPDQGKGASYLLCGPDYDGEVPEGYRQVHSATYFAVAAVRILPIGGDIPKAMEALGEIRIYPLKGGEQQRFATRDITGEPLDVSPITFEAGLGFWRNLLDILDLEPVSAQNVAMLGLLAAVGIEKGKPFPTDEGTLALLEHAAQIGRDQMLISAYDSQRSDILAWDDRKWEWAALVADNGDFETPTGTDLEARDRWFIQAILASPAMFRRAEGGGSLYWQGTRDETGSYLDGGERYVLDIPQPVPAALFWSVTVYDAETRSQIQSDQNKAALRSMFELKDVDTTTPTRLYFGPTAPADNEDRWLQTVPGRGWFVYLRIYGPGETAFDGTWKPTDFVRVNKD